MLKSLLFMIIVACCSVAQAGQTEILCRIKGAGQKTFILDGGLWSSTITYKSGKGAFKEWCPETEDQSVKFGKKKVMCNFSGIERRNMLVWGTTTVDFKKPSWQMRYRHAKLGQKYKDSAPGGRETATCKHRN
jgi:hypothetical protein